MTESNFFDKEELSAFLSSHYQYCEHSDSDEFTISVGGSSGGNYWNDNPSIPYYKDKSEIADDIQSESFYRIKDYLNAMNIYFSENDLFRKVYDFAKEIQYSEYDTSHESEYSWQLY